MVAVYFYTVKINVIFFDYVKYYAFELRFPLTYLFKDFITELYDFNQFFNFSKEKLKIHDSSP